MDAFAEGTSAVAKCLAEMTEKGATTIITGGDSVAAFVKEGLTEKVSHVTTGGGASLEFWKASCTLASLLCRKLKRFAVSASQKVIS